MSNNNFPNTALFGGFLRGVGVDDKYSGKAGVRVQGEIHNSSPVPGHDDTVVRVVAYGKKGTRLLELADEDALVVIDGRFGASRHGATNYIIADQVFVMDEEADDE